MTRLRPGTLLRCEWDKHVAAVYDVDGHFLNDLEPAKGDVVIFLHYDDCEGWNKYELGMVLLYGVKCSIVLADFKRMAPGKNPGIRKGKS